MFSYQAQGDASQIDFIRSNVEGLFEGQKISKKLSDKFAFEMVNLKTMHKQLDNEHRNTLENTTMIDLNYANQFFNRIQLANSRQDIDIYNQNFDFVADQQSVHGMSQGWKGSLGVIDAETTLGFVQCASSGEEKYYPIYGFKISRKFEDRAELQLNIAQEIQGGGSYTGIYGNQVFKKAMVNGRVAIMKKISFLWDAGIGVSESTFDKEVAGVATMSASLEYSIGQNIKGNIGYSHRNLIDVETGSVNAEGHMMNLSLAVANF
ncbi:MAG: hypothetical protein R2877_08600 [Bdellovibrionota bacterium]